MGWVESMHIFCSASETARDACQQLLVQPNLQPHELEKLLLLETLVAQHDIDDDFITLLEVYYDNFIAIIQAKSLDQLCHTTRALLQGIESVFPNGILIPRLIKEGKWETSKEILG